MPILSDFQKALAQIFDPAFLSVLLKTIGLTVLVLIGVSVGFGYVVGLLLPDQITIPFIGEIGMLDNLLSIAAVPVMLGLSSFLMFPVAAILVGLFLDDVSNAVDKRHYPNLPPVNKQPMADIVADGLRFAGVFLVVNAIALVIYLLSTLLAPVIFWLVNGFLIGREFFHQVALRRMPTGQAHALRKHYWFRVWVAGILMAVPLSIPILNLIVPILGVATFTHQVERLRPK